jgi:hypothetical protein
MLGERKRKIRCLQSQEAFASACDVEGYAHDAIAVDPACPGSFSTNQTCAAAYLGADPDIVGMCARATTLISEVSRMKLTDVGTVIATRELSLPAGKTMTVVVGKPEKFPETDDYYCPYQLLRFGSRRVRYAVGSDAVQALDLALKMIGADLYTSEEAQAGELSWLGGKNLGFPVPDTLKDLPPSQS